MKDEEFLCRYWDGHRKVVTRRDVSEALKFIGNLNQLPPTRITTRSLRKGFASCSRRNSVLNQEAICERGVWKVNSKVVEKHYVTPFDSQGLLATTQTSTVSIQELQRLI